MDIIRRGADRMTLEKVARFYLSEFKQTMESGGTYFKISIHTFSLLQLHGVVLRQCTLAHFRVQMALL
jgi:hypothetical protein